MSINHTYIPGQTEYLTEADGGLLKTRARAIQSEINDTKKARSNRYLDKISKELIYINWELEQRASERDAQNKTMMELEAAFKATV